MRACEIIVHFFFLYCYCELLTTGVVYYILPNQWQGSERKIQEEEEEGRGKQRNWSGECSCKSQRCLRGWTQSRTRTYAWCAGFGSPIETGVDQAVRNMMCNPLSESTTSLISPTCRAKVALTTSESDQCAQVRNDGPRKQTHTHIHTKEQSIRHMHTHG